MTLSLPIDFSEFNQWSQENYATSMRLLQVRNHWRHMGNASIIYYDFLSNLKAEARASGVSQIHVYNLSGCVINLPKGVNMLMCGHLVDSHFYLRRTIELIRVSCFVRENPTEAASWLGKTESQRKNFKKKYQTWLSADGRKILRAEFPKSNEMYNYVSETGLHANAALASFQNEIVPGEKDFIHRIHYHDLRKGPESEYYVAWFFYKHLMTHFAALDWWAKHSKLEIDLPESVQRFFRKFYRELQTDFNKFTRTIPKTLWPTEETKL